MSLPLQAPLSSTAAPLSTSCHTLSLNQQAAPSAICIIARSKNVRIAPVVLFPSIKQLLLIKPYHSSQTSPSTASPFFIHFIAFLTSSLLIHRISLLTISTSPILHILTSAFITNSRLSSYFHLLSLKIGTLILTC